MDLWFVSILVAIVNQTAVNMGGQITLSYTNFIFFA